MCHHQQPRGWSLLSRKSRRRRVTHHHKLHHKIQMRLESWPGILIEIDWHRRSVQIPLCIGEWAASDCLLYEFNMFVQLQLEGPCPPFDGSWLFCNTSKQLHCWAIFFPFWMHRWPTTRTIEENQIWWTSKNLCGISRRAVKCRGGYYGKIFTFDDEEYLE